MSVQMSDTVRTESGNENHFSSTLAGISDSDDKFVPARKSDEAGPCISFCRSQCALLKIKTICIRVSVARTSTRDQTKDG